MEEVCHIIIATDLKTNVVNVSAPMKHKELCYDILSDAKLVIQRSEAKYFFPQQKTLKIEMNIAGVVDVISPLPPKEYCMFLLKAAQTIIEQFEPEIENQKIPL